jgi:uncharacterized protein YaeQ
MSIRCDLHVNGGHRRLVIVPRKEETMEHVALRLSAFLLFWDLDPKYELSLKHPALSQQEFRPDLVALNVAGEIALWVECGNVSLHKLNKLTRRYPQARLAVLKTSPEEGRKLRADAADELSRSNLLDIWTWPAGAFASFQKALREVTHVVGEAGGVSLNLVINETPVAVDLVQC